MRRLWVKDRPERRRNIPSSDLLDTCWKDEWGQADRPSVSLRTPSMRGKPTQGAGRNPVLVRQQEQHHYQNAHKNRHLAFIANARVFCHFGETRRTYSYFSEHNTNVVSVSKRGWLVALVAGRQIRWAGYHFSPRACLLVLLLDQCVRVPYHASQLGHLRHFVLSLRSFAQR